MSKDYCTWFPEKWMNWKFKIVPISQCCEIHDEGCSTYKFFRCLARFNIVGSTVILVGGFIGCIVKYPLKTLGIIKD